MKIDIVFKGEGPDLQFVEVENHDTMESVSVGEWYTDRAGFQRLTLDVISVDYVQILSDSSNALGRALASIFNIAESLMFGDIDRTEKMLHNSIREYVEARKEEDTG